MKYYGLAAFLFFITTAIWYKTAKDKEAELNDLKASNTILVGKYQREVERSRDALKLAYTLDSICDRFMSSRNAKQNNKQALDLATKLN